MYLSAEQLLFVNHRGAKDKTARLGDSSAMIVIELDEINHRSELLVFELKQNMRESTANTGPHFQRSQTYMENFVTRVRRRRLVDLKMEWLSPPEPCKDITAGLRN